MQDTVAPAARRPMTEFLSLDHVQLGMPHGGEAAARGFYGEVLGMAEMAPPRPLRGIWFRQGGVELHLHTEEGFRAGVRAHPALRVAGLRELAARCAGAGFEPRFDERYPGRSRFYVADPFGNQVELLELHADREVVSTRLFDAPRAAVFRAFSDPAILAQWWGPKGSTNTFHEFDLRTGGSWRFVMRGPDGREYQMRKLFAEVAPPERIVLCHDQPAHSFFMTILLEEEAGGTRVIWRMLFDSAEELSRIRDALSGANEENFERLGAQLEAMR